ncbi:hypothetical protein D9756_011606, partial [Leucocoprinus leucothites]
MKRRQKTHESFNESTGLESLHSPPGDIVVFEEYLHYAAIQRHAESLARKDSGSSREKDGGMVGWCNKLSEYKGPNVNVDPTQKYPQIPLAPEEEELAAASRSMRLASWTSIFYLITTDILGPFNAPFAIASVGWVPGILLYFSMALVAWYTSLILWRLFVRLDSLRYPLRSYSDIVERIYGKRARQATAFLQTLQLIVVVGVNCLANGQAFSQVTSGKICFSVCIVIWTLIG